MASYAVLMFFMIQKLLLASMLCGVFESIGMEHDKGDFEKKGPRYLFEKKEINCEGNGPNHDQIKKEILFLMNQKLQEILLNNEVKRLSEILGKDPLVFLKQAINSLEQNPEKIEKKRSFESIVDSLISDFLTNEEHQTECILSRKEPIDYLTEQLKSMVEDSSYAKAVLYLEERFHDFDVAEG